MMKWYFFICVVHVLVLQEINVQCSPHSAFSTGNLSRQRSRTTSRSSSLRGGRSQEVEKVLVPPDYKYKAYGKVNITVIDSGGLPWYCYTGNHVRCLPLFRLPGKWRTTRFPNIYTPTTPPNPNKARSTPPNPNKARSTLPTTTTTSLTTLMAPEEETTPMTTAARFRSTPIRTATQISMLDREPKYSKSSTQEENIDSNLRRDRSQARFLSIPEGLTFSKLIKVVTGNNDKVESTTGKPVRKPINLENVKLPRRKTNARPPPSKVPQRTTNAGPPSSNVKFKKTIEVVDKGGPNLNFTTKKWIDRLKDNIPNENSYTKVNINNEGWVPIQNSNFVKGPNNEFQSKIDVVSPQDDLYFDHNGNGNQEFEADPTQIDWMRNNFPDMPEKTNQMLTSTFNFNGSSSSQLEKNRKEGSVAESINQFIYSKFVKPNQLDYSQEDFERLNILPSQSTKNTTNEVFNVAFPWDKPAHSFIPASTLSYELPESTSPTTKNNNAKPKLPTTEYQKLSNEFIQPEKELESTTSNIIGTTDRNGSRAIGVEVITRRSFDNADDIKSVKTQQNSPSFVPIKPENGAVTVKLGINLKVDPKTRPKIKEEIDEAPNVEIAQAYTVFGEPCRDSCSNRGFSYTWCHKKVSSEVGTWTDYDYCTSTPNITHYGDQCIDKCEDRGEEYYWCHKDSSLWGYCTPRKLYKKTLIWRPKEEDIKPKLPLEIPLAFTVRGEACKDSCSQRVGYSYKWCKKMKPSNLGSWTDNDYCTVDSSMTAGGERCSSKCGFEGYSYAWCYTSSSWGYCTPESFLEFLEKLHPPGNPFGLKRITTSTLYPFVLESTTETPILTSTTRRDIRTLQLESFADFLREEKEVRNVNEEINEAIFLNVDKYPKNYRKAKGFTAWGESCYDGCEKRGYDYTWCHKFESSANGDWSYSGLCSTQSNITAFGENCLDECEKRGFEYFWCHKDTSLWGYCTPDKLLNHLKN